MTVIEFAMVVTVFAMAISVIVFLVKGTAAKPPTSDDYIIGGSWGCVVGIFIGILIGMASINSYWEKKLISEGLGRYETKSIDSKEVKFILITGNPNAEAK